MKRQFFGSIGFSGSRLMKTALLTIAISTIAITPNLLHSGRAIAETFDQSEQHQTLTTSEPIEAQIEAQIDEPIDEPYEEVFSIEAADLGEPIDCDLERCGMGGALPIRPDYPSFDPLSSPRSTCDDPGDERITPLCIMF